MRPLLTASAMAIVGLLLSASGSNDVQLSNVMSLGLSATQCQEAFEEPGLEAEVLTTYGNITELDCIEKVFDAAAKREA